MSVDSIASRLAQIGEMQRALAGSRDAPSTSFATVLENARTAPVAAGASGSESQYDGLIDAAGAKYGIDPALLKGLIKQESGFNPQARSGAGAVGLVQLMPATAASLGVDDPTDPAQAIDGGARYLKQQLDRFGGDPARALAAYNAGPGAVEKYGGIPPYAETQAYVRNVLAAAESYRTTTGAPPPTPPIFNPNPSTGRLDYPTT